MPPIGHMDWIGFRKLDPRPTVSQSASESIPKSTPGRMIDVRAMPFQTTLCRLKQRRFTFRHNCNKKPSCC